MSDNFDDVFNSARDALLKRRVKVESHLIHLALTTKKRTKAFDNRMAEFSRELQRVTEELEDFKNSKR